MNNLSWIFDGIGTELLSLAVGIIVGVVGHKLFVKVRNKQSQKAGKESIQLQTTGSNSPIGDVIKGDKYVVHERDALDVQNIDRFTNQQIEDVLNRGNDATLRSWCLELIVRQNADYLIERCIEKMHNNSEKYRLLESLAERQYIDSRFFPKILESIQNSVYQEKALELCIRFKKPELIKKAFLAMKNERYMFDGLKKVHNFDSELFDELYVDGSCFSNSGYKTRMADWLSQQKRQ